MKALLAFVAGFIIVCLLALFVAWIGAIEPFTEDAGVFAATTCFLAAIIGALSAVFTSDTMY